MALSKITGTAEIYRTNNISPSIYNVSVQDIADILNSATSNNSRRNIFGSSGIITANTLIKIASRSKYSKSDAAILNNITEIINNSESFTRKLILGSRKITAAQLINLIKKNSKPIERPAHMTSQNNLNSRKDHFKKADIIDLPLYGPSANKATGSENNNKQPSNLLDIASLRKNTESSTSTVYNFPFNTTGAIAPNTLLLKLKANQNPQDDMQNPATLRKIIQKSVGGAYNITLNSPGNLLSELDLVSHSENQDHQEDHCTLC
jgi:hypothetical protein